MLNLNPEDCDYGRATERLRFLLRKCDLDWTSLLRPHNCMRSFKELDWTVESGFVGIYVGNGQGLQ